MYGRETPSGGFRAHRVCTKPPLGLCLRTGIPRSASYWASSSAATFLVRLGSTWTPGPIVVETVIFLM